MVGNRSLVTLVVLGVGLFGCYLVRHYTTHSSQAGQATRQDLDAFTPCSAKSTPSPGHDGTREWSTGVAYHCRRKRR